MKEFYALLKEKYPTKESILTELTNLEAILQLPKGTEHFISDIHGESTAFEHVLRTGSNSIRQKIEDCFAEYQIETSLDDFCILVSYPDEKLAIECSIRTKEEKEQYLTEMLSLMLLVVHYASRKYTRSKVRKALPNEFSYIIEELLTEVHPEEDKRAYFHAIIRKVIQLGQAEKLVTALAFVIQRLVVDHLHVVGDIYDRGPHPDKILDLLLHHHHVDVQWGNHDINWIAAVSGSYLSMINVVRISARYNNLSLIENGYGIHLRPFIEYSQQHYPPLPSFAPICDQEDIAQTEAHMLNSVQQAAAILQFKLEHQLIQRRPEFRLQHRDVLSFIRFDTMEYLLHGETYPLNDFNACMISPEQPGLISKEEERLLHQLLLSFQSSEKLMRHVQFLMDKGSMYLCYNNNLLLHGCIPLHSNGDLKSLRVHDKTYSGKDLLDFYEKQVRTAFRHPDVHDDFATDMLWYLWTGESSSLFGKDAMTTFERYYIRDKKTHIEHKNAYYHLRNDERICKELLALFHLPPEGHIINGHTPVLEKKGENPIKANGRLLVIDGGYAKGYQNKTGLAGYTLISNSYGLQLIVHQPFHSVESFLKGEQGILSTNRLVEVVTKRTLVKHTNIGQKLLKEMEHLEFLYHHFDE